MSYLIAVFRSRNVTLKVFDFFQARGVNCSLVSTPQGALVGCGLSLRFDEQDFEKVKQIAFQDSFYGFFRVTVINRKTIVTKII
ncbi:MAG: DUF3343 domain-containing protein [Clostridia bacterium]|nr:DUF3343 domain-containing protein [Clostridia bacterium]